MLYNLYVDGGNYIYVFENTSYGVARLKMEAGKTHSLVVKNWGPHFRDSVPDTHHYMLTVYGEKAKASWSQ